MTIPKNIPAAFAPAVRAASERTVTQNEQNRALLETVFLQLTRTVETLQAEQAALKISQTVLSSTHRQEIVLLEGRYAANQRVLSTLSPIGDSVSTRDLERRITQLVLSIPENSASLAPLFQEGSLLQPLIPTLPTVPSPFQQAIQQAALRYTPSAQEAQRAELQARTELIASIKRLYAENRALKREEKQRSWEHQKKIAPLLAKVEATDGVLRVMRQRSVAITEMAAAVFTAENRRVDIGPMVEAYQSWALQRRLSGLHESRLLASSSAASFIEEAVAVIQKGRIEDMSSEEVVALRQILVRWIERPFSAVMDASMNKMLADTSPWMLLCLLARYGQQLGAFTNLSVENLGNMDVADIALPAYLALRKVHGKCPEIDAQQRRAIGCVMQFIGQLHKGDALWRTLFDNYTSAYTALCEALMQPVPSLFHKVDRELKRWQSCMGSDFRYIPQKNLEEFDGFGNLEKALAKYHTNELQLKPYLTEKVSQEWAKQRQLALMQGEEARKKMAFTLPMMHRNIAPEKPNAYISVGQGETYLLPLKAHVNAAMRPDMADIKYELFGLGRFECTYTFAIEDTPPKELYPAFTVYTKFRPTGDSSALLLGTKKFTWGGNVNTINWWEVFFTHVFPLRITKWWEHVEQRGETSRSSGIPEAIQKKLLLAEREVVHIARLKAYQMSCPEYLKRLDALYFHFYIIQAFVKLMGDAHAIQYVSSLHPDIVQQHLEEKGFDAAQAWLPPLPDIAPLEARLTYLAHNENRHAVFVRLKQYLRELAA